MNIVIPDDYQNAVRGLACFARLAGHSVTIYNDTAKDPDLLAARLRSADAVVLIRERTPIGDELLARLPRLKLISQTGRGVTHIDVAACTARGVVVAAGSGSPYATAELTWGLVLAAARRIPQEAAQLKAGRWQTSLGVGLRGRTLGVFGFGNIGTVVAGYGRAFGMRVLVWGRDSTLAKAAAAGYEPARDREEFFARSDFLTLHLRYSPDTHGIVGAGDLARMKPGAVLVNTSRAGLIAEGALAQALANGRPGCAAVDVYEDEPVLDGRHPLLALDNAVCTPHLGYVERDSYELYFGAAFDAVLAFAAGRPVPAVNPEALTRR